MTAQPAPLARVALGSSGMGVTPLNLGGNVFGWTADQQTSFAVLSAFTEAGGNFIDTADGYSHWVPGNEGGESEAIIGAWLATQGQHRDDLVIATKVSSKPSRPGLSRANIRGAVNDSLKRLHTDVIDLYYAHFDDPDTPLAETATAFSELVDAGKIRAIGVSNYTPERLREWFNLVDELGLHAPVALQPHYNLVERGYETGARALAEERGLAVLPYYALASGFLTGKYRPGAADSVSPRAQAAAQYLAGSGAAVLQALDSVAEAHGASLASVSLAWLRQQPTVTAPIASARTPEQLPELLASLSLTLTDAELTLLTRASAPESA